MTILILFLFAIKEKLQWTTFFKKKTKGQYDILKIWKTLYCLIFLQDYLFWMPVTLKLESQLCLMMYGNNISFVLRKIVISL